ncbi:cytochrome P450 [Entophlyctis helioformis]|nr:cytochrome P450 [Entophlyctis helioformis]
MLLELVRRRSPRKVAAAVAALIVLLCIRYRYNAIGSSAHAPKHIRRLKGTLPVIGGLLAVLKNLHVIIDYVVEECKENGWKTFVLSTPFSPTAYVFVDPASIEVILKSQFDNFVKGSYFSERTHILLGDGIFNADGHSWLVQRKTASNIFNTRQFRLFTETVFADEMDVFVDRLASSAESAKPVDLHDLFFRYTMDSFGAIAFGISIDSMKRDNVPFADAFDRIQGVIAYRFIQPLWWIEEPLSLFSWLRTRADLKTIRTFASKVIKDRLAEPEGVREQRTDLLSLFLKIRDDDGNAYSEQMQTDAVLNFIIAGRDTTAQALSWTIYYLNKYPKTMEALVAEIDATLGNADRPTYEQVRGMKYANAVFHEALRLSPSVPKNTKMCIKDTVFPDGTIVPAGANVMWLPYVMARNPNIWGANAAEFVPDRWLDPKLKQPSPFAYPVFHAGPRLCLGKGFAELEGVYVLVSLLRRFKVTVNNLSAVTYGNSLTMPMLKGMPCTIRERQL